MPAVTDPLKGKYCVITGCIARHLVPKPTFQGSPRNKRELYELSIDYAKFLATRLKGQPLQTEHESINIGTILHSWVNDRNEWHIKALIDRNSRAGNDMIQNMLGQGEVPGQICELSLSHQGLQPFEVSMVRKGARAGSTIDGIDVLDEAEVEAIKQQTYIPGDLNLPQHFATEIPCVKASVYIPRSDMTTYTALRNPTPPTSYVQAANPEVDAMMHHIQNSQQKQQQQLESATVADPSAQRAALMKQLQELDSKHPPPVQPSPQQVQFTNLLQKLSTTGDSSDPGYTGNVHILHSDPAEDQRLLEIAHLFQNKNILTKEQMESGKGMIVNLAQNTKQLRETIEALHKEKSDLQGKLAEHESDIQKQRAQTATLLKNVLVKANPSMSSDESSEIEGWASNYAGGKNESLHKLTPYLVKASALFDAASANVQSASAEMQSVAAAPHTDLLQQVQQILNPASRRVEASGSRKRNYAEMDEPPFVAASASASSSSGMWQSFTTPEMAALFRKVDTPSVSDVIRKEDLMSSKITRY